MFPNLRLEVMERFTAVEQYFRNSPKGMGSPPELTQTPKGLAFVQIYAIYEYTVREATRIAIQEIANHGHAYSELSFALLALFLDPQINSLRYCGEKNVWQRRLELLEKAVSDVTIKPVDAMPHDGSHFKHTQVTLILKTLGVRRTLTLRQRHLYKIDEIVQNRNSISHGDETAVQVGRRYSRTEIKRNIELMKAICFRLIEILSEHCSKPERQLNAP